MPVTHALLTKHRRRPGRPMHDSADTREALLDAAEEMFSAFGVEGASMRAISTAAGLTHAAVNYHYPTKERLLDAVLRRRGEEVSRRFGELLRELEESGRKPVAQELIRAIMIPHVELLRRDPVGGLRWLRIEARLMLGQDPHLIQSGYLPPGMRERLWRLMRRGYPGVPDALRRTSWYICTATLLQMLGNSDVRIAHAPPESWSEAMTTYVDILTKFAASGFATVMADVGKTRTRAAQRR